MLKVYICEDDIQQLNKIKDIIEELIVTKSLDMQVALATQYPEKILSTIKSKNNSAYGVYFFDVDLKSSINGIELGAKIRKHDPRAYIIYITIHPELCALTFKHKVEALDYISKTKNNIRSRIKACLRDIEEKHQADVKNNCKGIFVKVSDREICFSFENILFFETSTNAHRIILYTHDQRIEFYGNLSDIEKKLDKRFVRCHRSILINIDKIQEIKRNTSEVILSNNQVIHISSNGTKALVDYIQKR